MSRYVNTIKDHNYRRKVNMKLDSGEEIETVEQITLIQYRALLRVFVNTTVNLFTKINVDLEP